MSVQVQEKYSPFLPDKRYSIIDTINFLIVLGDGFVILYLLLFNLDRTWETGVFQALWIQIPVLMVLILLARIEHKVISQSVAERYQEDAKSSSKVRLFQETGQKVEMDTGSSITSVFEDIVTYLLVTDAAMMSILFFYGFNFQEILFVAIFTYQAYFLPPILFFYLIVYKNRSSEYLNSKYKLDFSAIQVSSMLQGKKIKVFFLVISILLLLASSGFMFYANANEDFYEQKFDMTAETRFEQAKIFYTKFDGNRYEVFGIFYLANRFGRTFPHFTHISMGLEGQIYAENILFPMGRVNESIIDFDVSDQTLTAFVYNDDFYYLKIVTIDLSSNSVSSLLKIDLLDPELPDSYRDRIFDFQTFTTLTTDTVYIFNTPLHPFIEQQTTLLSMFNKSGTHLQTIDLRIKAIDSHNFNDKIHVLHYSNTSQDHFSLLSFRDTPNFNQTENSERFLETPFSENIAGERTPNGATLFSTEDTLYYRSSRNIHSITDKKSYSKSQHPFMERIKLVTFHAYNGHFLHNGILFLSSYRGIHLLDPQSLETINFMHGLNAHYRGDLEQHITLFKGKLFTSSTLNWLYIWPTDQSFINRHERATKLSVVLSALIYFTGMMGVIMIRRIRDFPNLPRD